jgi:hypothetical protein
MLYDFTKVNTDFVRRLWFVCTPGSMQIVAGFPLESFCRLVYPVDSCRQYTSFQMFLGSSAGFEQSSTDGHDLTSKHILNGFAVFHSVFIYFQ